MNITDRHWIVVIRLPAAPISNTVQLRDGTKTSVDTRRKSRGNWTACGIRWTVFESTRIEVGPQLPGVAHPGLVVSVALRMRRQAEMGHAGRISS